jgi:hypothetical protein
MAVVLPPMMEHIGLVRHYNMTWTDIATLCSSTHTPAYVEAWFGQSVGPAGPRGIDMYWRVVVPGTLAVSIVYASHVLVVHHSLL